MPFALTACRGHDRAPSADGAAAATDEAPAGTLPAPEAAPGTNVTGMPTAPPPPQSPAESVATAEAVEPAPAAATTPAPVDETSVPDTAASVVSSAPASSATPAPMPAASTPPAPADTAGAANLVTQYMAALGSGAFARGQMLWSTTPNDSAVLQLARNAPFDIGVGSASIDAGGRVTVPVDVRGKADDGSDRHLFATYTVQRGPAGNWRILSATVRDLAP